MRVSGKDLVKSFLVAAHDDAISSALRLLVTLGPELRFAAHDVTEAVEVVKEAALCGVAW